MGTLSVQPPSGSMRSLTEVFILLRNNAIQSKHIFANPASYGGGRGGSSDERMQLVPLEDEVDVEMSREGASASAVVNSRIPPEWVNVVDEVQYEMTRVRTRLKELKDIQQRHMTRPSFNDDSGRDEEARIETATKDITRMLAHCQRLIEHVKVHHANERTNEGLLKRNVVSSLIQTLQSVTADLRTSQTHYLKQIQNREDSLQQYFEAFSADSPGTSNFSSAPQRSQTSNIHFFDEPTNQLDDLRNPPQGEMTMAQIQAMEENTAMVKEREEEILHISTSIVDLNQLFKDLASFVVEQGTILDRIDYNVEQSNIRVQSALKSVKKAESYQKKNRKMQCILLLAVAIVLLLFLLIIFKS